jgi:peptide/nickel transport system substrate-binding protein
MANAAKDQWSKFGINVNLQGLERSVFDQNVAVGQTQIYTPWFSWSLASGDAWPQIQSLRSDRYAPIGEDVRTTGGTGFRMKDPEIDNFIAEMEKVSPESEENFEMVREFLKYWVSKAYFITQIGFKKFVTWDQQYWTGFPTSEEPDYMPLYWFHGGKYTFQVIKPVQ